MNKAQQLLALYAKKYPQHLEGAVQLAYGLGHINADEHSTWCNRITEAELQRTAEVLSKLKTYSLVDNHKKCA